MADADRLCVLTRIGCEDRNLRPLGRIAVVVAKGKDRTFAVVLAVLVAIVSAGSAPWWWHRVFGDDDDFVGGCAAFSLYAQNQFDPIGTKIWEAPSPTADSFRGFSPNELITVDGWVRTRSPYTSNTPPWDSEVCLT